MVGVFEYEAYLEDGTTEGKVWGMEMKYYRSITNWIKDVNYES
jgi:hypothetical protein